MGKRDEKPPSGGTNQVSTAAQERLARKAAALRANLRKRKAQQRGREEKPEKD